MQYGTGLANRFSNLLALGAGAAGVRWSGPEYQVYFECAVYACIVWAVITACREITARGVWKICAVYALLIGGCASFVGGLSYVAAGGDWRVMTAIFRPHEVVTADQPSPAPSSNKTAEALAQAAPKADNTAPPQVVGPPPPTVDLKGNIENNVFDTIKGAGTGTVLKGQGDIKGNTFKNITGTFRDAKFTVVPLTKNEEGLTTGQIKGQLNEFSNALRSAQIRLDTMRDNEADREAWMNEFNSIYIPRARTLQSLIVSKSKADPNKIPDYAGENTPEQNKNSSIRLGRSWLGHEQAVGSRVATDVINYLTYLAEALPQ